MSVRRRVTVRLGGAAIPVQYARVGGLDETSAVPPEHAARPDAASSVAPVVIHYRDSLRPCLRTISAPRRRATFRQTLLGAAVQPAARRFVRAQSHESWIAREARRPPAPMLEVRAHHEPEERLAAPERPAPALPVTAPQLLVVTDALHRAPPQPPELACER